MREENRDRLFIVDAGMAALVRPEGGLELSFPEGADAILLGMRRSLLGEMFESFRPGLEPGIRDLAFSDRECEPVMIACHERIPGRIIPDLREAPVSRMARQVKGARQLRRLARLAGKVVSGVATVDCGSSAAGGESRFLSPVLNQNPPSFDGQQSWPRQSGGRAAAVQG